MNLFEVDYDKNKSINWSYCIFAPYVLHQNPLLLVTRGWKSLRRWSSWSIVVWPFIISLFDSIRWQNGSSALVSSILLFVLLIILLVSIRIWIWIFPLPHQYQLTWVIFWLPIVWTLRSIFPLLIVVVCIFRWSFRF